MKILSRRFLASYLSLYVAILFASMLIISIVEMMLNFDDFLESSHGSLGIATYLALRIPTYYLPYLAPFASFGASFLAFGLAARVHEIVAVEAGGIAPQHIATAPLLASGLIGCALLLANETMGLNASQAQLGIENREMQAKLFQDRGSFWYREGRFLYNVQSADRANQRLYGVEVFERDREGLLVRRISAQSAQVLPQQGWRLSEATIRRFDPDQPDAAPRTRRAEEIVLKISSEGDRTLFNADPEALPLLSLRRHIDALERGGRNATRARLLFHSRLAEPASIPLFALLAIPLGIGVGRGRHIGMAALLGLGLLGLFYTGRALALLWAGAGVGNPTTPWSVVVAFGVFGVWRFQRMGR